jgi:hypothetical protein
MNQNDCSGKTLKLWPVFVDHYTAAGYGGGAGVASGASAVYGGLGSQEMFMVWEYA